MTIAIIAAAGKSTRAAQGQGAHHLKQFCHIDGKAVLWYVLQPFLRCGEIAHIRIMVDGKDAAKLAREIVGKNGRVEIADDGGETRAGTVVNGLKGIGSEKRVVIHDAARPCLTDDSLRELLAAVGEDDNGGLLAIPVADALKRSFGGKAQRTLSRNNRWRAQTPQVFRAGLLLPALVAHPNAADDSAAMERAGFCPLIVRGRADNIKITDAADLQLAAAILINRPQVDDKKPAQVKVRKTATTKTKTAAAKPARGKTKEAKQ